MVETSPDAGPAEENSASPIPTRRLEHLTSALHSRVEFPRRPLVIALSGGADSAAAAWLATQSNRACRAVHVNHRLPDSTRMAKAARAISQRLGLALSEVSIKEQNNGSEQALRSARYEALGRASTPDEAVITAHTADDQAETVLHNLLRGAGLDGIAGIPSHRGRYHRPMLGVWRSETRELATLAALPWEDDPQNDDPRYLRNRIRRQLIPHLEGDYQPRLREGLVRLSALAASDLSYLEAVAARTRVEVSSDGWPEISCSDLAALPTAISSRVIRRALRLLRGPHAGASAEVARVLQVAAGSVPRTQLEGGATAIRRGDRLIITLDG